MNTRILTNFFSALNTLCMRGIHFCYAAIIRPRSGTEDSQRHEFILNVILIGSIILALWCTGSIIATMAQFGADYRGVPLPLFIGLDLFFIGLLVMSRRGWFRTASYVMIAFYYLVVTMVIIRWGVELPLSSLAYMLVIVFSSILISTRFGFVVTGIIGTTVLVAGYLQIHGFTSPDLYWKATLIRMNDAFELAIIFTIIMAASWLSNREIESSLKRARRSEHHLKLERNSLEIKVEERTRELKEAELDKVAGLYRMAEFGRLSSGLFHDLMNPLQGVIASVQDWDDNGSPAAKEHVKQALGRAVHASNRMGNFLGAIRKQIHTNELDQLFSLNKELHEAIDILRFKARASYVVFHVKESKELQTIGNPLKFHQIAVNLLVNAIDACEGHAGAEPAVIHVKLSKFDGQAMLKVTDPGCGIPAHVVDKVFDPFFTTKPNYKGMGLGLSTTKSIIEKDFGGTIEVTSVEGHGASFTVMFPIRKEFSVANNK